jgi:hypothetical protein
MIKLLEILNLSSQLYTDNSDIHGKGLFTKTNIPKGSRILLVADFNKYSTDPNNVITPLGKFINHINSANTEVKMLNKLGYLYSTQDISSGDELTVDYKTLPKDFEFNKNINGFKMELDELSVNNPRFGKDWIRQNIHTIMKMNTVVEEGINENYLDLNLDFHIIDVKSEDTAEYYFDGFIISNDFDNCESVYITNNLEEIKHNEDMEGPGTHLVPIKIKGINILISGIGC